MFLLYKKCDVCGNKINKLQNIFNFFALKTGEKIICSNCNIQYKTNGLISIIGSFYTWGGIWILPILLVDSFLQSLNFNSPLLWGFIIYCIFELVVMMVIPLKKIKKEESGESRSPRAK